MIKTVGSFRVSVGRGWITLKYEHSDAKMMFSCDDAEDLQYAIASAARAAKLEFRQDGGKEADKVSAIKAARETMRGAFEEDEHFKHGYVSNIAMLLHDQYRITDYEERTQAAEDILRLIFW